MLTWKEYTYQKVGEEPKGLDRYGASIEGNLVLGEELFFDVFPTEDRLKQYRPRYAVAHGYILMVNNYDVFSGSLPQCQEEAQRRADRFLGEFGGEFSPALLIAGWTGDKV